MVLVLFSYFCAMRTDQIDIMTPLDGCPPDTRHVALIRKEDEESWPICIGHSTTHRNGPSMKTVCLLGLSSMVEDPANQKHEARIYFT